MVDNKKINQIDIKINLTKKSGTGFGSIQQLGPRVQPSALTNPYG
jgi:hypothetical protein